MSQRGRTTVRAVEVPSSGGLDPPRAFIRPGPDDEPDDSMKKPGAVGGTDKLRTLSSEDQELQALMEPYLAAVGETDKLRALTEDPELRALMEQYQTASASEREAALKSFIEKTAALHPDWRETWEAAESDGRIVRALAIHCVLRIRTRADLDELERFEAKTAEAEFVTCFDEVAGSPNTSAAFRMMLAFWELMRIAKLDPEEMKQIAHQARKDNAARAGSTRKSKKAWVAPAPRAAWRLFKQDPFMKSQTAAETIKETMGEHCPDVR
jgi:hypothetical protein